KQIVQPEVFDLREVIRDMHRLLLRLIGDDIDLQAELAGDAAPISADRGQIEQVVMNLAINASDAMPAGGRLTIDVRTLVLRNPLNSGTGMVAPGNYVLLTVTDTGCGMDASTLVQIFEPFFTTKGEE